jgi:hypothetical protein
MNGTSWHLDKRVPVAIIVAMVIQVGAFGFWVGSIANEVENNTEWIRSRQSLDARMAVLEEQVKDIKEILRRIEARVTRDQEQQR